jgi:hypothetical protein
MTEQPPATPVDRPPVPRTPMSWLVKIYLALAGGALAVYLAAGLFGWDFKSSTRDRVPGSVRNSPGGYRAYYLWHGGYHGGK